MTQISHGERAGTHDTTEDSFLAPSATPAPSAAPEDQLARLRSYLAAHHPADLHRTNLPYEEPVADVAIRLLMHLGARVSPYAQPRCTKQHGPCNKPAGHAGNCGQIVS